MLYDEDDELICMKLLK